MKLRLFSLFYFFAVSSCGHMPWSSEEAEAPVPRKEVSEPGTKKQIAKPTAMETLELKYARLWARLDELEEELSQQKELIELLERGQRTGIMPSRLAVRDASKVKGDKAKKNQIEDQKSQAIAPEQDDFSAVEKEIAAEAKKVSEASPKSAKDDSIEEKLRRLALVQDLHRQGSYGQSMAEVNTMLKELGDTGDGLGALWVARNWLALKEYQLASENFQRFLKIFPNSSYMPRARLDLARSDLQRGLRNKANHEFQSLMREFPNSEIAEIAAMELERLQKTL